MPHSIALVGTSNAKLLQGTLDMLILKSLMHGSMHGYGVAKRIQQLADEELTVEEGSLYPALHRLAQQGWISAEWGISENNQRARYYNLTRADAGSWRRRRQIGNVFPPRSRA